MFLHNIISRLINWDKNIYEQNMNILNNLDKYNGTIACLGAHTNTLSELILYIYYIFSESILNNKSIKPVIIISRNIFLNKIFTNNEIYDLLKILESKISFIFVNKYEKDNFNYIVEEIRKNDYNLIVIDPSGKYNSNEFRSGYYNLAKLLNFNICAIGFDFLYKRLIFFPIFNIGEKSKEECDEIIKNYFLKLHPYSLKNIYKEKSKLNI